MVVQGHAQINIVDDPTEIREHGSPKNKPFLRVRFDDGTVVNITTNLAEMIGGCGAGVRQRHGY
jgi:hypothetical protein